jgi:CHAT domain-containing protein/Tfp pilus assembly protein PilF
MSLHVVIISVLLLALSGSPAAALSGLTSNPQKTYSLLLIQTGPQESRADISEIKPGLPIERELAGGQAHTYRITLMQEQYLHVVVEQKGIDVVVTAFHPDGQKIVAVDSPNGKQGPEPVLLLTSATGDYRIEVKALKPNAAPGRYEIRIESLRGATTKDRDRVSADRGFRAAEQLHAFGIQGLAGAYQKALEKYQESLTLWRSAGDRQREGATLCQIAAVYDGQGLPKMMLHYAAEALSVYQSISDRKDEATALNLMGVAHFRLAEPQKALEYLGQALTLRKTEKDRLPEAATLTSLGAVIASLGEPRKALDYHGQALALRRAASDPTGEALTLNNIGEVYFSLNEPQKALDSYSLALSLEKAFPNPRLQATLLHNTAHSYYQLGEHQKTLDYLNKALPLWRIAGDRSGEAKTLDSIGVVHFMLDELQKAIEYFEQSVTRQRALGDKLWEAYALSHLGAAYARKPELQKALEYLNEGLQLSRAIGNRDVEAYNLRLTGSAYLNLGDYKKAEDHLIKALEISRAIGHLADEANILYEIARAERGLERLNDARVHLEAALNIIESARRQVNSPQLRITFLTLRQDYYEFYIDLLMQMHRSKPSAGIDATALHGSERARARGLLDVLAGARANIRQGVDLKLLERERTVAEQLSAKAERLTRLLRARHVPEQAAAARREVEVLVSEYHDVEAQIRATSPRHAALMQPQPLRLEEIQRRVLDENTLLLEYALGKERSFLWAVTPTSISSYELPGRSEIEAAASRFYQAVTANENRNMQLQAAAAADLGRLLLAPVAPELGRKRLVIVSESMLQYIPFAALPDPAMNRAIARKQRATSRYQPLIVRHEVVQVPSASIMEILRSGRSNREAVDGVVAVLADPVFQKEDSRVKLVEGKNKAEHPTAGNSNERAQPRPGVKREAWESGLQTLERLPFSRREAEAIVALAPQGKSLKALDFDASRATVIGDDIARYRIVHFATHGLLNNIHPELSGIVLSLVDKTGQPQNGFLRLHEVYNLKLRADLVVLSACRTALGKDVRGEGLIGLTGGFMYAGTPRVAVSLWTVSDEATAELMRRFYQGMFKKGLRPSAALQAAQVEMWRINYWSAPYYWAGFILQGDWR